MSEASTPLMQQYNAVKARYPHALLLFRLGDFYELFYEDAISASRELQITLTSRNREKGQPIPMCGVPYHAADGYIARLIRAGYKVAICEQMEQPGPGKKLVRREVSRVITPGTATDVAVLDARENNYLAAVAQNTSAQRIGLAMVDLSTGEFQATEFAGERAEEELRDELQLMRPRETLLPRPQQLFETAKTSLLDGTGGVESRLEDWIFQRDYAERILREQFGVAELTGFGLDGHVHAMTAAGAIVHYLRENAARGGDAPSVEALQHLDRIRYYEQHDALVLDPVSLRNLELLTPIFTEESKSGGPTTLIAAVDSTVTGMGARLLRSWVVRPLIDRDAIEARLGAVAHLLQQTVVRGEIRKELRGIQDLERLTSRITLGLAMPRELVALRKSVAQVPILKNFLTPPASGGSELLRDLYEDIDELTDVRERLEKAIADEPPAVATDPGIIRAGYNAELDELRNLSQHSKQIIAAMEDRERKRTGINSLKIRFNQVFVGLLHRNFEGQSAQRAPGLRAQANSGERGALHFAGTKRLREKDPSGRRAHPGDRAATLRRCSIRDCGESRAPEKDCGGDRAIGCYGLIRKDGGGPQLCAARIQWHGRVADRRRAASGNRRVAAPEGRAVCAKRSMLRAWSPATAPDHRPKHGRKIHLPSTGGADRTDGADGFIRARATGEAAADRPNFYAHWCQRQSRARPVHIFGGDERGSSHTESRHALKLGVARRSWARHGDI